MTSFMQQRADDIVKHLRENGFARRDGMERQALTLAEEAGEFVGAYRRWNGMARRRGSFDDVQAELADVVITAYVTAAELGIDLDAWVTWDSNSPCCSEVLSLTVRVGLFVRAYRLWKLLSPAPATQRAAEDMYVELAGVVDTAYGVATKLGFDLDAAIRAKLDIIFTRGWREEAKS